MKRVFLIVLIIVIFIGISCSQVKETPDPTLIPTLALPETIEDDIGIPMELVPAGEFEMGLEINQIMAICEELFEPYSYEKCKRRWYDNEEPVHTVFLDDYYIDKYEVTNGFYEGCVEAGVCDPPYSTDSLPWGSYYGDPNYSDYPVIYVSWDDANTFCEWRGARLPSEAEWEKAARGTDSRIYPWGDIFDGEAANFCDQKCLDEWANTDYNDGYKDFSPVGSYPQGTSPYDVHDMAGNVWEWVHDWYGSNYYGKSPDENPQGPSSGDLRVMRGGFWATPADGIHSAGRGVADPSSKVYYIGFRCAATFTSTIDKTHISPTSIPTSIPPTTEAVTEKPNSDEGNLDCIKEDMFTEDLKSERGIQFSPGSTLDYEWEFVKEGTYVKLGYNVDSKGCLTRTMGMGTIHRMFGDWVLMGNHINEVIYPTTDQNQEWFLDILETECDDIVEFGETKIGEKGHELSILCVITDDEFSILFSVIY